MAGSLPAGLSEKQSFPREPRRGKRAGDASGALSSGAPADSGSLRPAAVLAPAALAS